MGGLDERYRRDTLWVGKTGGLGWLIVAGVSVAATLLAFLLRR